jgi:hypothetical protein
LTDYQTFAQLKELSKLILSQGDNLTAMYSVCWQHANRLTDAMKHDVDLLFNINCFVTETRYIIEDSSYRQSANVAKLEIRLQGDDQLIIVAECLIDLGRIWLKVKSRPASMKFDYVADRIERSYNSEFVADLKNIN